MLDLEPWGLGAIMRALWELFQHSLLFHVERVVFLNEKNIMNDPCFGGISLAELLTCRKVLRVLFSSEEEKLAILRSKELDREISATEANDLAHNEDSYAQGCAAIAITLERLKCLHPQ